MSNTRIAREKREMINRCSDVLNIIMNIGGGIMPRKMIVEISKLSHYKKQKIMTQLKTLLSPMYDVVKDKKTGQMVVKEYPAFLKTTTSDGYVFYSVSLGNARLIYSEQSYAEPSMDSSSLIRRLQVIEHRIMQMKLNSNAFLSEFDSACHKKNTLPYFLESISNRVVGDKSLLESEIEFTRYKLSKMKIGKTNIKLKEIKRHDTFTTFNLPTILSLHQSNVFIRFNENYDYSIYIYEGKDVRPTSVILNLIKQSLDYYSNLIPDQYNCVEVIVYTVTRDECLLLKDKLSKYKTEIKNIGTKHGVSKFKTSYTNIFDKYFNGNQIIWSWKIAIY